jgi:ATP adenylyltransferase
MKYLWAPWRMAYILDYKQKGCIFCKKPKEKKDKENLILYRGQYACVMMNRFPYNNGHLMVFPKRHCPDFEELTDKEFKEIFSLIKTSIRVLKDQLRPHGFNIGMNIGKVGGAGFDKHVHFHIVPRWMGDTNFMPIIGDTKIIPEYLETTYLKIYSVFKEYLNCKNRKRGGD